ncbi:MAG: head closure knob [Chaetfec virus UA24_244]|nr:MAG: head closure knob [Chaetfec virus UA24_244]
MVNRYRKALERLWKDRCWVYVQAETIDPSTKLTDFEETPLLEDQPCKLSFSTLSAVSGDELPAVAQAVKLFLPPEVDVPPGSKIVVKRSNREFTFSRSGEPGIFSEHQEILLTEFKGWA